MQVDTHLGSQRFLQKTFNIRRYFSTPHHHSSVCRAEAIADVIHKSLRILARDQTDWDRHLQAIALAYRLTTNLTTGMSPFFIVFGRQMWLPIDWGLWSESVDNQQAVTENGSKLKILHQLALDNCTEGAARRREQVNADAELPQFTVGQHVLLTNPVTKKGESPKLSQLWRGPFVITQQLKNFNYLLQDVTTGKDLQRPVHATRLKKLHEPENDYRSSLESNVQVLQLTTVHNCKSGFTSVSYIGLIASRWRELQQPTMIYCGEPA